MSRFGLIPVAVILSATTALAEPQHGIAMYGEPALPPDFAHLPYANPDAPKGGEIVFGETGSFDSLNPWIQAGRAPWGTRAHVAEGLMGRSYDEPFTLYGLLAESVEMSEARDWIEFHLNPAAEFSDGSPVTVEDVVWSFETMGEEGHGRYRRAWDGVESWEQTGEHSVRFNLTGDNRELPLILALRPILKKADWDDREFTESSMEPWIASGPYVIGEADQGRSVSFERNPDYWGADLGFNVGKHNFDTIRYEFFGDSEAVWQAFTSGETNHFVENDPGRWVDRYDFPRVRNGEVVQSIVPHERPSGMSGLVFNTRNPLFEDVRVRDALIHAFNFEFINETLNAGVPQRIESYFDNSILAFDGAAEGMELALLEPFAGDLPADALEAYELPSGTADARNRGNLRRATQLLADAGWTVQDGVLRNEEGEAFTFEILINSSLNEPVTNIYADALERLGIDANITLLVDNAQYTERRDNYDFDMITYTWGLSLSPGTEQYRYWGSEGREETGTRNMPGIDNPAVDASIDAILNAGSRDEFLAATRALDRVLTTGRYVVPFWFTPEVRVAHAAEISWDADNLPIYGYWIGFMPDAWWFEAE
ncbi:extracellular solute-binding protein [Pontivivens insulae]|uniref:Oligopeptide-binding protein AppA n=1 Tax=Pontivivens insulae TaxID=1639689 RepID=A0A2R8ABA4_9RHOB|nr:extracellular solute-binding protein [Pontivivens insulae]RED13273.1 peptide/nickel transport system substrate-binding protein [Pontivivens insulae]SPF29365.1 Oligopeptide-binding protein AppA [Pontivivens insulae]